MVDAQQRQTEQQRLQNAGLELPALFHEGRRASDGLMCHNHQSGTGGGQQSPGGSPWARGTVVEGTVGGGQQLPLLSETHREHQALCKQYGQPALQQKQQQPQQQGSQRTRPVLRQVSYKLAQQQPILLGTPVSTISEAGSSEVSPDHDPDDPRDPAMTAMMMRTTSELDEWCRLPSSLAACDLEDLQSPGK